MGPGPNFRRIGGWPRFCASALKAALAVDVKVLVILQLPARPQCLLPSAAHLDRPPPYYKPAARTIMKKPTLDIYAALRLDASCEINRVLQEHARGAARTGGILRVLHNFQDNTLRLRRSPASSACK